jgi:S-adenosylmethionine decarboxylase
MPDIGKHVLADLYGVEPAILESERDLMHLLRDALIRAQFTIVGQLSHKFPGGGAGVTGIILLSESHAAFHTYPEFGYMALDIFSCGAADPEEALGYMSDVLQPERCHMALERRGKDHRPADLSYKSRLATMA